MGAAYAKNASGRFCSCRPPRLRGLSAGSLREPPRRISLGRAAQCGGAEGATAGETQSEGAAPEMRRGAGAQRSARSAPLPPPRRIVPRVPVRCANLPPAVASNRRLRRRTARRDRTGATVPTGEPLRGQGPGKRQRHRPAQRGRWAEVWPSGMQIIALAGRGIHTTLDTLCNTGADTACVCGLRG